MERKGRSGKGEPRKSNSRDKGKSSGRPVRAASGSSGTSGRPERTGEEKRKKSSADFNEDRPRRSSPTDRPYRREGDKPFGEDRPHRSSSTDRPNRREGDKPFGEDRPRRSSSTDRPLRSNSADRPYKRDSDGTSGEDRPRRSSSTDRPYRREGDKPFGEDRPRRSSSTERPYRGKPSKSADGERSERENPADGPLRKRPSRPSAQTGEGLIRLNKYIANSGVCSRREADELIQAGAVSVNGKIVTELGTKVSLSDKVRYDNQTIKNEKHVYVLLNKPKGYITTTDDPFDRNTVMTLVANACKERIYPVGRLDRNTSGLLLLTNDGELAKKLTHPKHNVKKVYHVELDKPLTKNDMMTIVEGIELEDGVAVVDEIAYAADSTNKKEIGIELHSGRNRIVRRIFEALGYEVVKLDRVIFAGLTKRDLPRGHWRMLSEQELIYLKMLK